MEHNAKKGLGWFEDKEELKVQQAEVALPGLKDSAAASAHDMIMEQKQNEPVPDDNEREQIIADALVKEIPVDMGR